MHRAPSKNKVIVYIRLRPGCAISLLYFAASNRLVQLMDTQTYSLRYESHKFNS